MRWNNRIKFLFLMPAALWVLVFTVFPLGYSLYASFVKVESRMEVRQERVQVMDAKGQPVLLPSGKARMKTIVHRKQITTTEYVGGFNYRRMFSDPQLWTAVKVTAVFVLGAVPAEMVLGLLLAFLFNQPLLGRPMLRSVMILPLFATPLAVGYIFFTILYEEGGPLGFLGIPFLSNPDLALASVILVDIWQWTPFCFLVFLAALQGISGELIEAARLDTASNWQLLKSVILPMLTPTVVIILFLRLAEALKLFDIPYALTGGGPGIATQSYTFMAFRTGLRYFDLGYASAMAYGLLIFVMIIVTFFFKRLRETYG